ncbi:MAG: hypothetical protein H0X66_05420 [Verrucomicrobia bacterium]|nr:hypothetical protein [Verrucomicrobiota bacterium]
MLKQVQPIIRRLAAADRSFQKEIGTSLFLRSCKYLLGFIVLCFVVDVVFHLEATWRVLLLGAFVLFGLFLAGRAWFVAYVRKNSVEHIARVLETRDAALGSKLINILQLQAQSEDAQLSPLTRQMARQAVDQYGDELRRVPFEKVARTGRVKVEFKRAATAFGIFAVLLLAAFKITTVEFPRFVDPFGDHPPYSFTQLEISEPNEDGMDVVYKKNALIKATFKGHKPGELFLTFHPPEKPGQSTTIPMFGKGDVGFYQEIADIRSDLVAFVHTKNKHSYSKKRNVRVVLTPKVDKAFVQIAAPAYTGLKADERGFLFKDIRALTGSEVRFRLQSNRPLKQGTLQVINADKEVQTVLLQKTSEHEVSGSFVATHSARLIFAMLDVDGITSDETLGGSLTITHDLSPDISIVNPQRDTYVSMDYKLEAQIEATDDYGLATIRIHRALNRVYSPPKIVRFDTVMKNAREALPFDFQDLGLRSGDVISMFAEAIDTSPQGNLSRSQIINITVISEEEYNTFVREQTDMGDIEAKYSQLLDQFHDRIEEQQKLTEKIEALEKDLAKAEGNKKKAVQEEMDRLLAQQSELNQSLNKVAERMENFVRKNPLYDIEAELQNNLREKAEAIRESTAQNESDMQRLAQNSPQSQPTPEMLEDFKRASEEQARRLAGTEAEAREEVAGPLQDLSELHELMKNFSRFEQLFHAQQALVEQARPYDRGGPLNREDQLALKNLAATENEIAQKLKEIEERLKKDADVAEKNFPKAAQGARDLAEKMDELRLNRLAMQATDAMLKGRGEESFQGSERLRGEMEKLFGQCNAQGGQMSEEMDQYLKLQRGMNAGNSFQQMMQSRKFGGGQGKGLSLGKGEGRSGSGGFAVMMEPSADVLGNETSISRSGESSKQKSPAGYGQTKNPNEEGVAFDKPDVVKGIKSVNRESDAVTSETVVEEYRDLVDKYFKAITK